ncbi:MAG: hypothetical protein RLZZ301_1618 [Bacteroidota bacterium]|jgi:GAF domain-containing protein
MAEQLFFQSTDRQSRYAELQVQLKALIGSETDWVANMANLSAALHAAFHWHWVGFYLVKENELLLGPFQGPIACTRIAYGKGVCGTAWQTAQTVVVPDVDAFPGHIACSSLSKSEIVVPLIKNDHVIAVLDIDSTLLQDFDENDQFELEKLMQWFVTRLA